MCRKEPGLQGCENGDEQYIIDAPTSFHSPSSGGDKADVEKTKVEMLRKVGLIEK